MTSKQKSTSAPESVSSCSGCRRKCCKYPVELSGGMKQRTVIATSDDSVAQSVYRSEPSSALDVTSQKMVIKMILDLMEKKAS